jgi:SH3-like domain-containing protein
MRNTPPSSFRSWLPAGLALLAIVLPAAQRPNPVPVPACVALEPVTNMHSRPDRDADVVSQVVLGRISAVLARRGRWLRIRCDDAYEGWVPRRSQHRLRRGKAIYGEGSGRCQVYSLQTNVYREPDVTRHAPLLVLPFGSRLEATPATVEGWLAVRLPDGRGGWVQLGDAAIDPCPLSIDEMLVLARRFVGITYLWGGVSSFGIDCSGFTQLLQRQRGIVMPRDAHLQAAWAGVIEIAPGDLRPGDLLFFGESPQQLTHTGMALGAQEFIHAATAGRPGVQVSRLDEPRWQRLLQCCRRVR